MIAAFLGPVSYDHAQIQVPALDRSLPFLQDLRRPLAEGDRREPGRTRETFLRAAVADIEAPFVHLQRQSAERRDGIHDQQRPRFARNVPERFERLAGARRRFAVNHRQNFQLLPADRPAHLVRVRRGSGAVVNPKELAAAALDHLAHARGKHSANHHSNIVAGLDEINQGSLHARAPRSGNGEGRGVLRAEHRPQHGMEFVHGPQQHRIEVTHHGLRHGAIDARVHFTGTGSHQQAFRNCNRRIRYRHH